MKNRLLQERARQRVLNPQTLARLRESGSDVSRVHKLCNVVHVFSQRDVESVCRAFETAGYMIEDRGNLLSHQGVEYWLVTPCVETVPTPQAIEQMTDECVGVANEFDADYDGWYTEVVPSVS